MPHSKGGSYRDPKTGKYVSGKAAHDASKRNPGKKLGKKGY
jgi:hypothetical protein